MLTFNWKMWNKRDKNFGKLYKFFLDKEKQLYVPPNYAHGFYCITDEAFVHYKCTDYYDPISELTISVKDFEKDLPEINFSSAIISQKDK